LATDPIKRGVFRCLPAQLRKLIAEIAAQSEERGVGLSWWLRTSAIDQQAVEGDHAGCVPSNSVERKIPVLKVTEAVAISLITGLLEMRGRSSTMYI
jgi:hypothetical protein